MAEIWLREFQCLEAPPKFPARSIEESEASNERLIVAEECSRWVFRQKLPLRGALKAIVDKDGHGPAMPKQSQRQTQGPEMLGAIDDDHISFADQFREELPCVAKQAFHILPVAEIPGGNLHIRRLRVEFDADDLG